MKAFVIDASVIIKWIFPERKDESHLSEAIHLLKAVKQDKITVLQPVHWLAEVSAVMARLQPKIAMDAIDLLYAMEFKVIDNVEIFRLACDLSQKFDHHLFDTLYHAVALYQGNTTFITADEQYYKKTYKQGAVMRLADFSVYDD